MARKTGSSGIETARGIRDAALKLFADKGFAAVSMREIAREVGVQVGALYLYTPDKQSLLADLMIAHLEDLLAAWQREGAGDLPPSQAFDAFVGFHISYHLTRVDEVFIAYMELRSLSPENFAKVERLRRLYENVLQDILIAGEAEGIFRLKDARVTTLALIAMLTGVNTWYRAGGRLSPERIEEIYRALARDMVGAP
ncbi:TetR/AcrR family transcriptional regulator [Algicella marina]|uniref:TetR family transcriptional regulator n=1 Tax=Algicella marina TaxID=2683284 RepID=A0A6P1T1K5_9RHOB|nr:TetR/AcrR family transcriptional regulator [Algicella marina]QHQ35621.1 TetR family transcriptional regulator [Algicella marina]